MAVILELAPGDTLVVGPATRIRMVHKSGQRARLAIDSDMEVERIKAGEPLPPAAAPAPPRPAAPAASAAPQPFLQRRPMPTP